VLSSGHRKHWDSCSGTGEHRRRRERGADAEDDDEIDELTAQEIEDEVCRVGAAMADTASTWSRSTRQASQSLH